MTWQPRHPVSRRSLQASKYFFSIPLPTGNVLIDSLFLQARLVATPDVVAILNEFAEPHQVGPLIEAYAARTGGNRKTIAGCVGQLLSQKLLWNLADGEEETRISQFAGEYSTAIRWPKVRRSAPSAR